MDNYRQVPVLWNGETLSSSRPPSAYLLLLLGLQLPEFVLLGIGLAMVFAVRHLRCGGIKVLARLPGRQFLFVTFNSIDGDLAHVGQEFELDYWGTSLGEAGRRLAVVLAADKVRAPGLPLKRKVFVCGDRLSAEYYLPSTVQITDKIDAAGKQSGSEERRARLVSASGSKTKESTKGPMPPVSKNLYLSATWAYSPLFGG